MNAPRTTEKVAEQPKNTDVVVHNHNHKFLRCETRPHGHAPFTDNQKLGWTTRNYLPGCLWDHGTTIYFSFIQTLLRSPQH